MKNDKKEDVKVSLFKVFSYIFYIIAICMAFFAVINLISSTFGATEYFIEYGSIESSLNQTSMYISFIASFGQAVFLFFLGFVFNYFDKIYQKIKKEKIHNDFAKSFKQESHQERHYNKSEESEPKIVVNIVKTDESDVQKNNQETKKRKIFCEYCGNELNENERKCPYCGASKKIIKEFDN